MAEIKEKTISIVCPNCQAKQMIAKSALSVFCRNCQHHIETEKVLHPEKFFKKKPDLFELSQEYTCFRCNAISEAGQESFSFFCKKCGYRNDIQDYTVKTLLSKNIETRGILNILNQGTVLNSTALVNKAIISGKFIGNLDAQEVELHENCIFEGNLKTDLLILDSPKKLALRNPLQAKHIIIPGLYKGKIKTEGIIELGENAEFYGNIFTKKLIIKSGAVFSGTAEVSM